jgi:hypothetical protein
LIRLPSGDALRVDVNHYDPVLGAILGDNGHRRPANVSSADA